VENEWARGRNYRHLCRRAHLGCRRLGSARWQYLSSNPFRKTGLGHTSSITRLGILLADFTHSLAPASRELDRLLEKVPQLWRWPIKVTAEWTGHKQQGNSTEVYWGQFSQFQAPLVSALPIAGKNLTLLSAVDYPEHLPQIHEAGRWRAPTGEGHSRPARPQHSSRSV